MHAIETVRKLKVRIEAIKDEATHRHNATALVELKGRIVPAREAIDEAIQILTVLERHGLVESSRPSLAKIRQTLSEVTEAFDGSATSLKKKGKFNTLVKRTEKAKSVIMEIVSSAWREEFAKAPKPNKTLMTQIGKLKGQRKPVEAVNSAYDELRKFSTRPPSTKAEWKEYERLKKDVAKRLKSLSTDKFPKAALKFCIAAQQGTATLDMLTDDVKEWLEDNGMLDHLRLRLG